MGPLWRLLALLPWKGARHAAGAASRRAPEQVLAEMIVNEIVRASRGPRRD